MNTGFAFYVPPETYPDPSVIQSSQVLNFAEHCRMELRLSANGTNLGRSVFRLRRPPVILAHGIMSSPDAWPTDLWHEQSGSSLQTRLYLADWSATSTLGYSENYFHVSRLIEDALEEYRNADDAGHDAIRSFHGRRYAATRADVVAHSQGGQITRWFISENTLPGPGALDRVGWIDDISDVRSDTSPAGRWNNRRSANFGAGSIRRFLPLGSPFRGSPYANIAATVFAPGVAGTSAGYQALIVFYNSGLMPDEFEELLFPGGAYLEPTCVSDLSEGSEAQLALEAATYPGGPASVRWYPLVGIATQAPGNAPVQSTLWELLFTLFPLIPNNPTSVNNNLVTDGDLIVPAASQRNWNSISGHPNGFAGEQIEYTAHSEVPGVLPGETQSIPFHQRVAELLVEWPSIFYETWSLGQ